MERLSAQAWNNLVQKNRHILTGRTWKEPVGKVDFAKKLFQYGVKNYLWYAWPRKWPWQTHSMSFDHIGQVFNDPQWARSFGNVEAHNTLRLRGAPILHAEIPSETGKIMPLRQIGHFTFGHDAVVNFEHLFETGDAYDGIQGEIARESEVLTAA